MTRSVGVQPLVRSLALAWLLVPAGYHGTALAQNLPNGSYLQSCTNASVADGTLVAQCRRADQTYRMTSLPQAWQCQGRISNNDGRLECPGGLAPQDGGNRAAPPPAPPLPQTTESASGSTKLTNVCRDGAGAYLSVRWHGSPDQDIRMLLDPGQYVRLEVPRGTSYAMECGRGVSQQAAYRYLPVTAR